MSNLPPTALGKIVSVSGSSVSIILSQSTYSGLAIINGTTYRVGQVGSFVRIPQGYQDLFAIVTDVGSNAAPNNSGIDETARWLKAQLIGEALGEHFERGISQYPNINDEVHLVTEEDLARIYKTNGQPSHISIGKLASAENIDVKLDINKLLTRHSAIVGSTGSGKSTTLASIIRSIVTHKFEDKKFERARVILLDIHGEYGNALKDIANVFRIHPNTGEYKLNIPFWALESEDLVRFLTGGISDEKITQVFEKIIDLKKEAINSNDIKGIADENITIDSPIPYSIHKLWFDFVDMEAKTFSDSAKTIPTAKQIEGDIDSLIAPKYLPHGPGSSAPFLNHNAPGIKKQLGVLRSRLVDKQLDSLLHPGELSPDKNGKVEKDLDFLLDSWLGLEKPITVLDLSGVPSIILSRLVGTLLRIVYDGLFWGRNHPEGGRQRPILIAMEEAHRYLSHSQGMASSIVQKIVKEGRKYGIGAMIISQRPSEIDETILSQCGTVLALRLSNNADKSQVKSTLSDNLAGIVEMLPILRTGELIAIGEATRLPTRCRVKRPADEHCPDSNDPNVTEAWAKEKGAENYTNIVNAWRSQSE